METLSLQFRSTRHSYRREDEGACKSRLWSEWVYLVCCERQFCKKVVREEMKFPSRERLRELESKRSKLHRALFDRQDEIDAQCTNLVAQLEEQSKQRVAE